MIQASLVNSCSQSFQARLIFAESSRYNIVGRNWGKVFLFLQFIIAQREHRIQNEKEEENIT